MSTMHKGTCPKCHSGEILPHADASNGNSLAIRVYEKAGVTLKGMRNYPLRAWVCTHCGYTIQDEAGDDINDQLELIKWVKENCPQAQQEQTN